MAETAALLVDDVLPYKPAVLGKNNYQAIQGLWRGLKNSFRTVLTISNKSLKKLNFLFLPRSDQNISS
jgi:hypothetical protein